MVPNKQSIPETLLRRQAWKYYAMMLAWPAYLFFLPWIWSRSVALGLIIIVFPGVYLFTGIGFLMHESWHRYVPNVPNDLFYRIFAWMLLTDPQIYRMVHGYHHSQVHSWEDAEFHPFGEIKFRTLRILSNISEIVFGIAHLVVVQTLAMIVKPRFKGKYRISSLLTSICTWIIFLGSIGWATKHVFSVSTQTIIMSYILTFWIGGIVLHHSQLVEHGNLIVAGDWNGRNIKTRNLSAGGLSEKIFLFFTQGDSREHVLHHVAVSIYSRPFPGKIPLPSNSVMVTLRDYGCILFDMILGRTSTR